MHASSREKILPDAASDVMPARVPKLLPNGLIQNIAMVTVLPATQWLLKGSFANCRHEVACLVEGF